MELDFASTKLFKLCTSAKKMKGDLGERCAKKLQQRLEELNAASTLEEMRGLPGARCHELVGDRSDQLAVDVLHPKRLIFTPNHDPSPAKDDGGLDWTKVTKIIILEIVDYH